MEDTNYFWFLPCQRRTSWIPKTCVLPLTKSYRNVQKRKKKKQSKSVIHLSLSADRITIKVIYINSTGIQEELNSWRRLCNPTWKSDMILRMAVSTMLAAARFLALSFLWFNDEAGQSNYNIMTQFIKQQFKLWAILLRTICSVSHMQSWAAWYSRLNAAVFSNSSRHPSSAVKCKRLILS